MPTIKQITAITSRLRGCLDIAASDCGRGFGFELCLAAEELGVLFFLFV
jgi:hypothetical protein